MIGPNGAGKTTLFNVICGFVRPDVGHAAAGADEPLARGSVRDRLASLGIARTLQGVGLFPRLTVLENVMVGAERFRRARLVGALLGAAAVRPRRARAARPGAGGAGPARLRRTSPSACPGRFRTRCRSESRWRARSSSEPELLLLDEPAGGLDADELSELGELIESLGSSIAVMLVDHHMDLVTSVCDRVVVLDFGRVIAAGVPPAVRADPRVLEAYLGREAEDAESRGERSAAMLTVEDLTTDYGPVRAVDDVSLEVPGAR